jgi:uncharacterized phage protein (TIGR02216 family)
MKPGNGASSPRPFPWDEALGFGLGVLRLPPEQFWRLTPVELAALARARRSPGRAPDRAALEELMAAFPDPVVGLEREAAGCAQKGGP